MILKFSRKILLACLLCALAPLGLAALTLWREPGLLSAPAQVARLLRFLGLTVGFAFSLGIVAAFLLNRELRQALGGLRAALDQFSPGPRPVVKAALPQDELTSLLAEVSERLQGQLIGVPNLEDEIDRQHFTQPDVVLAQQFAHQSATAIGNARLFAAANRHAERLVILHEASRAILSRSLNLEQVYEAIDQAVGQLMPNDALSISLLDEAQEFVEAVYLKDRGVRHPNQHALAEAGLTRYLLKVRRPLLFHSADEWPVEATHSGGEESVQSVLAVPLQVGGYTLGALVTQAYQPHAFSEDDIPLLVTLANQTAAAIQNGRLFQSVQRQFLQLSILQAVAQAAVSTSDPDQVIRRAMETLRERVGYDYLALLLINPAGTALQPYSFGSTLAANARDVEVPLGLGVTGRVAQTGQPRRVNDVDQEPGYLRAFSSTRAELCVPLKVGERVIGVLNAEATTLNAFGEEDERLLTIVAGLLAPIIENAELYARDRKRLNELSLLNEVTLAAVSASSLEEVITQAMQVLRQRLGYEILGVALLDESGEWVTAHPDYFGVDDPRYAQAFPVAEGIVGAVIRRGRAIRVEDVTRHPDYRSNIPATRSQLAVPLKIADRVIGAISTESHRLAAYGDNDERLLTVMAGLLAPIIENARLRAHAEQQAHDLDLIARIQATASASLELDTVLGAIVEQVGRALQVTSAYVVEINETHTQVVAEYNRPEADAPGRVSDLHRVYPSNLFATAVRVLQSGQPLQMRIDDLEVPEFERAHMREFGGRAALLVPLVRHGRPLGYVEFWEARHDRIFTKREIQLAETLAGSVAAALENATLYQEARRQAEQMRLVNEVGRDVGGILDVDALLKQVSQRLETAFGYYHAEVGLIEGKDIVVPARSDARRDISFPEVRRRLAGPGIMAWVARHSEPRLAPDVLADSEYVPDSLFPETRAEAAVPLIAADRTIGVLDVQSDRLGGLGKDDLTILQAISGQLAVAAENARLYSEARQRAEEVSALLATTMDMSSSVELNTRLDVIARSARRLVDADSCIIYKVDPAGRHLRPLIIHDNFAEQISAYTIALGEGLTGMVALTGQAELVNRADLDPRSKTFPGTPTTPDNLLVAPLQLGGRTLGVMAVYREGLRGFTLHDLNLVSSFAAQAAVAIENTELYQGLKARANSLQAAYNELAAMDRRKDEMVQNISHELRTPLTFLRSYVDLLINGQLGELLPEQEKSLRIVANKTQTLVRLVNDILTLQAVTPATIKHILLDLASVARAAAEGVRAAAEEAGLTLSVQLPPQPMLMEGDPLRLTQVFDNLMGNAMKFTNRGGEIHLSVKPGEREVRVEVCDTGIGIAPENLERIFDRFYQADGSRTRKRGGMGLGLSISRLIVEAHGGRIGVESKPGEGSCFYFVLPITDRAEGAALYDEAETVPQA